MPASPSAVVLNDEECWRCLRSRPIGRLAIAPDGQPLVFPVDYAVGKKSIVFRTAPGTKLERGPGSKACFEIDDYSPGTREGWSVMAVGTLQEITESSDPADQALRQLPVHPLAPGEHEHWIVLRVAQVSGRHFTAGWIVPGNWLG